MSIVQTLPVSHWIFVEWRTTTGHDWIDDPLSPRAGYFLAGGILMQGRFMAEASGGEHKAGHYAAAVKSVNDAIAVSAAKLNAFVRATPLTALVEAETADRRLEAGGQARPLEGLAIGVKDIIDVSGLPTEAGSLTRKQVEPAKSDAHVVTRLRAAGAIVAGKTHTVEYAFGGWGTNLTVGTPWNPWDRNTHRTPGGSSSGSGVAVGSGLLRAALGTDTGGSVRIPAAFCGCVGLKTSIGLVGRSGVVPLAESFDTIGPMTADVATAARMLAVMQGEDPADETTFDIRRPDPLSDLGRGVRGLRLAILSGDDMPAATREMGQLFDAAVGRLSDAGATVSQFRMPSPLDVINRYCGEIMSVEAYWQHRKFVDDPKSSLHGNIRSRMAAGSRVLAAEWLDLRAAWKLECEKFLRAFDRFDALLLPTTPFAAQPAATVDEGMSPGAQTRFVNYLELCGLSVPMALTSDGLPAGLQIVCRRFDDPLALRIGYAFEQMRGAFPTPPRFWAA